MYLSNFSKDEFIGQLIKTETVTKKNYMKKDTVDTVKIKAKKIKVFLIVLDATGGYGKYLDKLDNNDFYKDLGLYDMENIYKMTCDAGLKILHEFRKHVKINENELSTYSFNDGLIGLININNSYLVEIGFSIIF